VRRFLEKQLRSDLRRVGRFGLAGGISTLVSYVCFPLVYEKLFLSRNFVASFALSTFINVTVSYLLQRTYVFRSRNSWAAEYVVFWTNAALIIMVAFVTLAALLKILGLSAFIGNFIVVSCSAVASYWLHKNITFRNQK
jgi:putative flippase GtrA